MIGTIDIKVNAAHPNMPLCPIYAHIGSPSQVRIINVPKAIGKWAVASVQITANYPDNTSRSVSCTLVGGCWSATLPASTAVGQSLMGFKVTASGTDETGAAVTGYVLGKGDVFILNDDSTITIGSTTYYVHLLDVQPTYPKKGDLCLIGGAWKIYNGTEWIAFGGGTGDVRHAEFSDMSADLEADNSSLGDVMTKVNTLITKLKGTTAAIVALLALVSFAAVDVQTAPLKNLPGKTLVVTNVVGAAAASDLTTATNVLATAITNKADNTSISNDFPIVTNAYTKSEADGRYLQLSGGEVTGTVTVKQSGTSHPNDIVIGGSQILIKNKDNTSSIVTINPEGLTISGVNILTTLNTKIDATTASAIADYAVSNAKHVSYGDSAPDAHKTAAGILSTAENTAGTIATNVVAEADTNYIVTNAVVALNQSKQSVEVAAGASLTILKPSGTSLDWIVYANCAADNTPLILPSGNYYADDTSVTNALKAGVTALYFTSCGTNGIDIARKELKPFTIP